MPPSTCVQRGVRQRRQEASAHDGAELGSIRYVIAYCCSIVVLEFLKILIFFYIVVTKLRNISGEKLATRTARGGCCGQAARQQCAQQTRRGRHPTKED